MPTLLLHHADCQGHAVPRHHPESPARLGRIMAALGGLRSDPLLESREAREIGASLFAGVHPRSYLAMLAELEPGEGLAYIDGDTPIGRHSLRAARLAAGANIEAVEAVLAGAASNAFCAIRPPGHHAEAAAGMGFCLFNNVALAAERALQLGARRVTVADFDVHHGNGTVDIFLHRPEVQVCSSFQYPFYPGRLDQVRAPNIVLTPLPAGTEGGAFRLALEADWMPAIRAHRPDLILVSAGFDAHRQDPLGGLLLEDEDFLWVSRLLLDLAGELCGGRLVSTLEGGYHLDALGRCVAIHVGELLGRAKAGA